MHIWRHLGTGSLAPCTLYLGTKWRQVVSCTPWPHCPRGRAPSTYYTRGWVGPTVSGHFGEEEISCPCQNWTTYSFFRCTACSLVTILTDLSWLIYNCVCLKAEHIALEQLFSTLSSKILLMNLNKWSWMVHIYGRIQGGGLPGFTPPPPVKI